ncbi:hypothetical protein [Actinoplanes sp. NPDC051851]|uniref:hypothetical protein n=1 Tax=Actinoplanes sp. NPDC051851 TaxID=3154753 RepID=UPI003449AA40
MIATVAVVLSWAGVAYDVSRPTDYRRYVRTMVQVAESGHDAAQTGRLIAQQQVDGRITAAFGTAAYDDAAKGLAGAQKKFAGEGLPDERSQRLRDELSPLLTGTVVALGDTVEASDDRAREAGSAKLGEFASSLEDFIEAYG